MNGIQGNEQRLAAIGVLAGGMAHDFNNVLAAIHGYGERALSRAARGSRLRGDLESILAASERGRSLVEQVLTLAGSSQDQRRILNVEAEIRDALDLLSPRLPAGVSIEAAFGPNGSTIFAGANDLHRLFMNLVTNALQAMPHGGTLRISVTRQFVAVPSVKTVGELSEGRYAVLRVGDSGTGIDPALLPRIFDLFFSTRRKTGGTGLGLWLVRAIASEIGAAIEVESCPGHGTLFSIYLPIGRIRAAQEPLTQREAH